MAVLAGLAAAGAAAGFAPSPQAAREKKNSEEMVRRAARCMPAIMDLSGVLPDTLLRRHACRDPEGRLS
jgi:hypothetical protein